MNEIKLNSLSPDVFNVNPAAYGGEIERAKIVGLGRLVMAERNGRDTNRLRTLENMPQEYTCRLTDDAYSKTSENVRTRMVLFAAKMSAKQVGAAAPADYAEFLTRQRDFATDPTFMRALSGIITEIVRPMLPVVVSNALGWLAKTVYGPIGKTIELELPSNDFFLFEDDSWGARSSKPANTLYDTSVTLNPRPRTARATMKWYQLVGNGGDLGRLLNAIALGMYNKITGMWAEVMVALSSNAKYVPSALQFAAATQANWSEAIDLVSTLNGRKYNNVVAFGTRPALARVVPDGIINSTAVNLDAAIATMLGTEYARYGYIPGWLGATLMPLDNSIVAGTQNTTMVRQIPTDMIWMCAMGASKPVYVGFEQGGELSVTLTPNRDTADMSFEVAVTTSVDMVPVVADKIAVFDFV